MAYQEVHVAQAQRILYMFETIILFKNHFIVGMGMWAGRIAAVEFGERYGLHTF